MGKEWGSLIRARHLIFYSLSPFAQRPFAGYFREVSVCGAPWGRRDVCVLQGIPNTVRRFKDAVLYPIPGFLMAGLTYLWMEVHLKKSTEYIYILYYIYIYIDR